MAIDPRAGITADLRAQIHECLSDISSSNLSDRYKPLGFYSQEDSLPQPQPLLICLFPDYNNSGWSDWSDYLLANIGKPVNSLNMDNEDRSKILQWQFHHSQNSDHSFITAGFWDNYETRILWSLSNTLPTPHTMLKGILNTPNQFVLTCKSKNIFMNDDRGT